jgi:hypothetical protein
VQRSSKFCVRFAEMETSSLSWYGLSFVLRNWTVGYWYFLPVLLDVPTDWGTFSNERKLNGK